MFIEFTGTSVALQLHHGKRLLMVDVADIQKIHYSYDILLMHRGPDLNTLKLHVNVISLVFALSLAPTR